MPHCHKWEGHPEVGLRHTWQSLRDKSFAGFCGQAWQLRHMKHNKSCVVRIYLCVCVCVCARACYTFHCQTKIRNIV